MHNRSGVSPEIKLGLLTDPSQNFSSQKRTFHKMFRLKNGPFTKFFQLKMDFHKIFPVKNGLLSVRNEQTVRIIDHALLSFKKQSSQRCSLNLR